MSAGALESRVSHAAVARVGTENSAQPLTAKLGNPVVVYSWRVKCVFTTRGAVEVAYTSLAVQEAVPCHVMPLLPESFFVCVLCVCVKWLPENDLSRVNLFDTLLTWKVLANGARTFS